MQHLFVRDAARRGAGLAPCVCVYACGVCPCVCCACARVRADLPTVAALPPANRCLCLWASQNQNFKVTVHGGQRFHTRVPGVDAEEHGQVRHDDVET